MEEKKKNKLYLKWWFWLIILILILTICFSLIVFLGYSLINPDKNLSKLANELKEFHNDTQIYQSYNKNNIVIDCNFDNSEVETEKEEKIGEIIGENIQSLVTYENIQVNLNVSNGEKSILNINPQTQEINKTIETWTLQNSDAEKEKIKEIAKLETEKEELNTNISELTETKQSLDKQIEKLNEDVIKIKGQPKTYPAGHLTAGTDIPIGKYKIYDGSSNFVVYSSYGTLRVNIILGGNYGVNEYVYTFSNGDKIEASSSFKLVEIE